MSIEKHAQAILDAMKWANTAHALPAHNRAVAVKYADGTEARDSYSGVHGWCKGLSREPVAWRELV